MKNTIVCFKFSSAVVFQEGRYRKDMYELSFTNGFNVILSFSDINGSIGIAEINEVIGENIENFGFHKI